MNKSGFVLLEIIISIALGSLVMAGLFSSFFQINKAYKSVDDVAGIDTKASLLQYQMDRDISGVSVPFILTSMKETSSESKEQAIFDEKNKGVQVEQKKEEIEAIPMEKSFYATAQGENLNLLSFVSSNPLSVYDKAKPRIVRITYQLIPEENIDKEISSYRLLRSESSNLSFSESSESGVNKEVVQTYELASGIQDFSADFIVKPKKTKQEELGEKQTENEQGGKEVSYEQFRTWADEEVKKVNRTIPHIVKLSVSFWEKLSKKSKKFSFTFLIVSDDVSPLKRKEVQASPKKESDQKKNENEQQNKPVTQNSSSFMLRSETQQKIQVSAQRKLPQKVAIVNRRRKQA